MMVFWDLNKKINKMKLFFFVNLGPDVEGGIYLYRVLKF